MTPKSEQIVAIRYLRRLGLIVLAWGICSVAFTVLVDPYRMYGTPGIRGWTELKPRIYQQSGLAKTNALERVAPRTLLLGNSRVEIGFDPDSNAWPAKYQPVFNAAQAGRGIPTALAMLREDIALHPPRTVFLGLDFQDFLTRQDPASTPLPPIGSDEKRLLVIRQGKQNGEREVQIWRDRFATTLTFDALFDSVLTILDQDAATTVTMTNRGFNPLHEYRVFARRTGYGGLFLAKEKDYQQQYSSFKVPDFIRSDHLANFRDLAAIITLAHEHGIELIFFTQPYHAAYLEMLHQLGLWPAFEQWKRSLAEFAFETGVPLYDFSEYDHLTTEEVPGRDNRKSEMRWYWEPGHYKEALGDEMLKVMISGTSPTFGRRLTPATVEAAIREVRNQRGSYLLHRADAPGLSGQHSSQSSLSNQ